MKRERIREPCLVFKFKILKERKKKKMKGDGRRGKSKWKADRKRQKRV